MVRKSGPGNVDDPEKDPSYFPESRVRPWLVDRDAEWKVRDTLDNLEKTLTFVSPVKDGVGARPLDRVPRNDDRAGRFLSEIAALEARRADGQTNSATRLNDLRPIGEVFEDLYRETHGLPSRRKLSRQCSAEGVVSSCHEDVSNPSGMDSAEEDVFDEGGGVLANDPDVARLLAELQRELDVGGGDSEGGGGDEPNTAKEEALDDGTGGKGVNTERSQAYVGDLPGERNEHTRADDGKGVCHASSIRNNEADVSAQHATTTASFGAERKCGGRMPDDRWRGSELDISRMKIDGRDGSSRPGTRPQSAPSAYRSDGGFSRMSRSSSSHLARTISQKLSEASKETSEAASERKTGTESHRSAGIAIAHGDDRIDVLQHQADALQASMSVKRKSYLKGCRPRAVRWRPRHGNFSYLDYQERWRRQRSAGSSPPNVCNKRPQSAGPLGRGQSGQRAKSPRSPILRTPEMAFVFGPPDDEAMTGRPPSERRTTPARMLRRVASASEASFARRGLDPHLRGRSRPYSAGTSSWQDGRIEARRLVGETWNGSDTSGAVRRGPLIARVPRREQQWTRPASRSGTTSSQSGENRAASNVTGEKGGTRYKAADVPLSRPQDSHVEGAMRTQGRWTRDSERTAQAGGTSTMTIQEALEAVLKAATGSISPAEQFKNARKTIREMKEMNTKDNLGDILISTQV